MLWETHWLHVCSRQEVRGWKECIKMSPQIPWKPRWTSPLKRAGTSARSRAEREAEALLLSLRFPTAAADGKGE